MFASLDLIQTVIDVGSSYFFSSRTSSCAVAVAVAFGGSGSGSGGGAEFGGDVGAECQGV